MSAPAWTFTADDLVAFGTTIDEHGHIAVMFRRGDCTRTVRVEPGTTEQMITRAMHALGVRR